MLVVVVLTSACPCMPPPPPPLPLISLSICLCLLLSSDVSLSAPPSTLLQLRSGPSVLFVCNEGTGEILSSRSSPLLSTTAFIETALCGWRLGESLWQSDRTWSASVFLRPLHRLPRRRRRIESYGVASIEVFTVLDALRV